MDGNERRFITRINAEYPLIVTLLTVSKLAELGKLASDLPMHPMTHRRSPLFLEVCLNALFKIQNARPA